MNLLDQRLSEKLTVRRKDGVLTFQIEMYFDKVSNEKLNDSAKDDAVTYELELHFDKRTLVLDFPAKDSSSQIKYIGRKCLKIPIIMMFELKLDKEISNFSFIDWSLGFVYLVGRDIALLVKRLQKQDDINAVVCREVESSFTDKGYNKSALSVDCENSFNVQLEFEAWREDGSIIALTEVMVCSSIYNLRDDVKKFLIEFIKMQYELHDDEDYFFIKARSISVCHYYDDEWLELPIAAEVKFNFKD
jgi:hypothetical protein